MSDNSFGKAQNSTSVSTTSNQHKNTVSPIEVDESVILEQTRQDLVKNGVRAENAVVLAKRIVTQVTAMLVGPLPTVQDFSGYDEVCPGAARDILDMAKNAQLHQHKMENWLVKGDILLPLCGIAAAVLVIICMLLSAVYAAIQGHDGLAIALASGTGIASVVGVFVRTKMVEEPNKKPQTNSPKANKAKKS